MSDEQYIVYFNDSYWQHNGTMFYPEPIIPHSLLKGLWDIYMPLVAVVGCVLNVLASIIFSRSEHLRSVSKSHYLAAMTASDAGFLVTLLIINHISLFLVEGVCQLIQCCNYVFHFLSIWFSVAFLSDVYIGICKEGRARKLCTVLRSKFVITGITVLAVVMFVHVTWMSGVKDGHCMLLNPGVAVIDQIQTAVTILIPDVCTAVFVALILRRKVVNLCISSRHASIVNSTGHELVQCLNNNDRNRSRLVSKEPSHGGERGRGGGRDLNHRKVNPNMNFLALCLVGVHAVTTLPDHVVKLRFHFLQIQYINASDGFVPTLDELYLQQLLYYIGQLHFLLDFIIFTIVLRDFRRSLRLMAASWRSKLTEFFNTDCCSDRIKYSDGTTIEECISFTEDTTTKSSSEFEKHDGDVAV